MNKLMPCCGIFLWIILQLSGCGRDDLEQKFHHPPESTKPWVYWYWISDNISKEGLSRDLEAMAQVGIGNALIGNIFLDNVQQGDVQALSEQWWEMVEHAIREGKRTGVDIGMFNCPGWSQSGGPWIKPDQSMRYLVYSEDRIKGPSALNLKLKEPANPFQPVTVVAFPAPKDDADVAAAHHPMINTQPVVDDAQHMMDHDLQSMTRLPDGQHDSEDAFIIDIRFNTPYAAQSLSIHPAKQPLQAECELWAADEQQNLKLIERFRLDRSNPRVNVGPIPYAPVTIAFPMVQSGHYRLVLQTIRGSGGIAELELSSAARLERYIEKQLAKMHPTPLPMWDAYLWPKSDEPVSLDQTIDQQHVIVLDSCVSSDGILNWQVPQGEWIIMNIGMTPTGTKNSPASPNASGLEVDKMNRQAAYDHFQAYMGKILRRMPEKDRQALKYVIADSYEMGSQNWTDGFRDDFIQTYGYDPLTWLPVLSGRIVNTAGQSDRFLWDMRRLIADRIARDYVGGLRDIANEHGLKLWLENYGHWGFPAEFLQYGGQADQISGEFWANRNLGSIELRAASSASHIYGMPVVSAEAFTGGPPFSSHPFSLKHRGDWAYTEGINHFVLHVYIHQPWDDRKPGVNAWFGTEFNRHNTWFYPSKSWIDYLRRCHVMLQQGVHVADIAYFIGEDTPKMTGITHPQRPSGYDYNYINAEAILTRLQVKKGQFVLPDGMTFNLLVLPDLETMRPELLQKIRDLVKAGGVVYGSAPHRSPSLQGYPGCDSSVQDIAKEMWQKTLNDQAEKITFGKGQIFNYMALETVFENLKIPKDVDGLDTETVLWTHRKSKNSDIYFLSNQTDHTVDIAPVFRVSAKIPEIWDPVRGKITQSGYYQLLEQGVRVPLRLERRESCFIVFREKHSDAPHIVHIEREGQGTDYLEIEYSDSGDLITQSESQGDYTVTFANQSQHPFSIKADDVDVFQVDTPWSVKFKSLHDSPKQFSFAKLESWPKHTDERIRYYSGTASYSTRFQIPETEFSSDDTFILDLGDVQVMAEVILNGKNLGTFWMPPFQMDVSHDLLPGENKLVVHVTNVWKNRLIGDAILKRDKHKKTANKSTKTLTFLTANVSIGPDNSLMPAGLLGPVRIVKKKRVYLMD
ncbi:hypothetical protein GF406_11720 [candidate division KSB1 bacterium]|nr:hypothetical protein [candidate division KSB1 bacterium]